MPSLDLPLSELENYKGSGCCPTDFSHYWMKQKSMVDEVPLEYVLNRHESLNEKAIYYDLFFTSFDGALIHAKYVVPNHHRPVTTVIQFHDYAMASKGWHHLTRYIALDYAVLAMDCRGQGGLSEDLGGGKGSTVCGHLIRGIDGTVDDLYYRRVFLDAYLLSRIADDLKQTKTILTYGCGQGGALAIVVAALNEQVKKCVALAPFLSDFKRVWEMDLDVNFYEGLRYYFRWFDPMHLRETEIFTKLSYIDVSNFAPQLTQPFLLGTGLLDATCPPSTQYAIFNTAICEKRHVVFAKFGHELINAFENECLMFMCE